MKQITCNFCGVDDTQIVNHGPDLLLQIPGDFYLVRCCRCGLIYQNPQLSWDELAAHYPDDYLPYQIGNQASAVARLSYNQALGRLCDRVSRRRPQAGRLLDVGCATGDFLMAMQARGWQVEGVEPAAYAAAQAREQGLTIFTGELNQVAYPASSFEVITLWDVLEHVPDPRATLQEAARILRPGGLLVFSLPNPDSVEARLFGTNWVGWERPRHLHLIPLKLIPAYLDKAGLCFTGVESFNGRLSLTLLSVEFALKARGIPESKWRHWLDLAYNLPLRVATWPLYKAGEQFNLTTVMTIFAEQPLP